MVFLMSISDKLDLAVKAITSTVKEGLGPIALLSDSEALADGAFQFAVDFGIQIVATILLFLAVRFLLWKPVTKILEARKEAIDKELSDAQSAKAIAIETQQNLEKEYEEAKSKIKEMLDNAERDANMKRDAIVNEAKAEAERRIKNLEIELEEEKKSMNNEIRKEIVDIAFQAAEKIVGREINQDKYLDVVDDILKGAINE